MRQLKINTQKENLISSLPIATTSEKIKTLLEVVCMELGVPQPSDAAHTSIIKLATDKFCHFTFAEIKEAFRMNLAGDLDHFFYKSKSGKPENELYGTFTPKYFATVLNAYARYRQHKMSAPGNQPVALLEQTVWTPEKINESFINYRRMICEWFEKKFPAPYFTITDKFNYEIFLDLGLVPEWGLTEVRIERETLRKRVNRAEKVADLNGNALYHQYGTLIKEACEKLKKSKKSLREIMSKHYGKEI